MPRGFNAQIEAGLRGQTEHGCAELLAGSCPEAAPEWARIDHEADVTRRPKLRDGLADCWVGAAGFIEASLCAVAPVIPFSLLSFLVFLHSRVYMFQRVEDHTGAQFQAFAEEGIAMFARLHIYSPDLVASPDPAARPDGSHSSSSVRRSSDDQGSGHPRKYGPLLCHRVARLAFLAPDLVSAILAGRHAPHITATKLLADSRLPLDWKLQREALAKG